MLFTYPLDLPVAGKILRHCKQRYGKPEAGKCPTEPSLVIAALQHLQG